MKEQISIPVSKVQRASKFLKTGAKVGGNYLKHYGKKLINPDHTRDQLDQDNAEDIYDSLSELKGSALKVAQMLSMDKNVLPGAYQSKFSMSQYSAPPLSYPLVVKTFKSQLGKSPEEIFDTFTKKAVNAASIGQVHKATLNGKTLAVKIQYPGIAESISSDLRIVKPIASRMFNISAAELDQYMEEVESKLLEETDYTLELKRSMEITNLCKGMENIIFPTYYPELSTPRILVMDWIDGQHLKEWVRTEPSTVQRNQIGQAMWDFYHYQIHELKQVHADPHPGNFLITDDGKLGIIDFGCVKVIPLDFYEKYFQLMERQVLDESFDLNTLFMELGFLHKDDSLKQRDFFISIFREMIILLGKPFHYEQFDFGDDAYFKQIFEVGERVSKMKEIRNSKSARGNRHGLYINRTYFGLYNLLNELKANIKTRSLESV
jgi:predicted unusual protein kinase regulating ubiquinone biosynthesis (AarF/ABC1/UbiB family)